MHFNINKLIDLVTTDGETSIVTKPWGWERTLSVGKYALIKMLHVKAGARTSLQRHNFKDEVMVPLLTDPIEGGFVTVDDVQYSALHGAIRVLPGMVHRVTGPLTYFEVSTYHPNDVVRLEDDYGR